MNTPTNHLPGDQQYPTALSQVKIPDLDMTPEGCLWPSCFSAVRLSEDGKSHEVMLNDNAGAEKGKIWKFSPSQNAHLVLDKIHQLKSLPGLVNNESLQEDIDTLGNFVTRMWIIDDGFSDHVARRNFFEEHPDASRYCEKTSKLRGNYMNHLGSAVYILNRDLGHEIATPLRDMANRLKGYEDWNIGEKTKFVGEVDGDILAYLTELYNRATA